MPPPGPPSSLSPALSRTDADYTVWPLWIDTHVTAPFKRQGDELNCVHPRRGDPIRLFRDVPEIWHLIKREEHDSYIAACSRTSAPE